MMAKSISKISLLLMLIFTPLFLSGCGFHLQGKTQLAWPLHKMYLHTKNPYGFLARQLRDQLKMSQVELVSSPEQADTILDILQDETSEHLLGVSGTQQTRQYNLITTLVFEVRDAHNQAIIPAQTLTEQRTITVQSNQILGSSNEVSFYYQQMRRQLAYALMSRLGSKEVSRMVTHSFSSQHP